MIRNLLVIICLIILYRAIKSVVGSAFKAYTEDHDAPAQLKGEEMVLDPECRTYVVKERALTRRLRGEVHSFCSEACAERYAQKHRG
jgi:YHS domain-containing protein